MKKNQNVLAGILLLVGLADRYYGSRSVKQWDVSNLQSLCQLVV